MRFKISVGMATAVVGAVLSLFFWDLDFGWFQGGPLGVLLVAVGVFEVGEGLWRSRRRASLTRADDGPGVTRGEEGTDRYED